MNLLILTTKFCLVYLAVMSPHIVSGITDGEVVEQQDTYPWFTRVVCGPNDYNLLYDFVPCGGMLISPEYVLTSARCITSPTGGDNCGGAMAVQIGTYEKPFEGWNGGQKLERFNVKNVIKHPNYVDFNRDNDYALLRLDGSSTINPVPMDSNNLSNGYEDGQGNLWAVGLGQLNETPGDLPDKLMHVEVKYIPYETCNNMIFYGTLTDSMMCAADDGKGICKGDTGGPLYDKDKKILVGLATTAGDFCGKADYSGVYTKVSTGYDWIKGEVCKNLDIAPEWCRNTPCAEDSPLAFKLTLKKGKKKFIKCAWIQEKEERKNYYCGRGKVETMCPSTCDSCDICKDSKFRFKVKNKNGKTVIKNCAWFSDNKNNRCEKKGFEGVSDTCRESCGSC